MIYVKPPKDYGFRTLKQWWIRHTYMKRPYDVKLAYKGIPVDKLRRDSPLFDFCRRMGYVKDFD